MFPVPPAMRRKPKCDSTTHPTPPRKVCCCQAPSQLILIQPGLGFAKITIPFVPGPVVWAAQWPVAMACIANPEIPGLAPAKGAQLQLGTPFHLQRYSHCGFSIFAKVHKLSIATPHLQVGINSVQQPLKVALLNFLISSWSELANQ
ncbi:unnamed protein product [Prunus armeniaca]|uniref:Uncharacterized protein n=1 Tax=Prunus armeniaca TaxID=36596 RepID=A0A6J5WFE2_PRUAR|nr:unnamed protein product [Prunus armeniaca]CAB4298775.1 unnamed protein product [Prunus armeniaca]